MMFTSIEPGVQVGSVGVPGSGGSRLLCEGSSLGDDLVLESVDELSASGLSGFGGPGVSVVVDVLVSKVSGSEQLASFMVPVDGSRQLGRGLFKVETGGGRFVDGC